MKFKRLQQELKWPFTRQEFDSHLVRLECVKTCLVLVLTSDSVSLGRVLHNEVSTLSASSKEGLKVRDKERAQMANGWIPPLAGSCFSDQLSPSGIEGPRDWDGKVVHRWSFEEMVVG